MSESMVEKVARAIYPNAWEADGPDHLRPHSLILARAAIASMREPTEAMMRKWDDEGDHTGFQETCPLCGGHIEGWRRMIDAALQEDKG